MDMRTATAAVRFGLGRRPQDPQPGDPVAWLDRQIGPVAPQRTAPGLAPPLTFQQALAAYYQVTIREKGDQTAKREMTRLTENDAIAWTGHCLISDAPFQDRLTNFWVNHFTISRRVHNAGIFVGPHLRDVIRANLFGRFTDMVIGTARHPGMIVYLSNGRSTGPNSMVGRRTSRGINENLAREIMELHTLSPAAGYTQEDVTSFARILTGWGVERQPDSHGFRFREQMHEPGPKTLMGRTFPEGEEGGIQALTFLAEHPATHRHLAEKLARHFMSDDPPKAAVDRLYAVLRDTRGDLGAACRTLVRLPEAWNPPLSKVRSPADYVLSVGRAIGAPPALAERLHESMRQLGQPLWTAPQPVGWPDRAEEWAVPEALMQRIEWAYTLAGRGGTAPAPEIARAVLGPLAAEDTLREAARAGSPQDALTLVLVSPEFQRR
ncbi:MAG TPA: DUF1800 domain-containing protein [Crenalkalicoccus sp.]|jgi:uncharacterized protein (DUF1800 family)|nr:DUF1800 domain-containing protein [Crenalkalicoccus sp.]